ncbi:MAG: hypothetical protein ACI4HI_03430 [Lachnospiraceae bacterium]
MEEKEKDRNKRTKETTWEKVTGLFGGIFKAVFGVIVGIVVTTVFRIAKMDADSIQEERQRQWENIPDLTAMEDKDNTYVFDTICDGYILENHGENILNGDAEVIAMLKISYDNRVMKQILIEGAFYDPVNILFNNQDKKILLFLKDPALLDEFRTNLRKDIYRAMQKEETFRPEKFKIELCAYFTLDYDATKNESEQEQYLLTLENTVRCERLEEGNTVLVDRYALKYGMPYNQQEYSMIIKDIEEKLWIVLG